MSSGQATPNISMSLWHSSLARWQRLRHGIVTWPYSVHTGVYRAHRNILRSALHTRFTMGWKGCRETETQDMNGKHWLNQYCVLVIQWSQNSLPNTHTFHPSNVISQHQWEPAWQGCCWICHACGNETHTQAQKNVNRYQWHILRRLVFNLK